MSECIWNQPGSLAETFWKNSCTQAKKTFFTQSILNQYIQKKQHLKRTGKPAGLRASKPSFLREMHKKNKFFRHIDLQFPKPGVILAPTRVFLI